jgi:hypothetical protein
VSGHVAVDFETFYSTKLKYSVRSMIAEEYCKSDLFHPYLVSVSDGKNCWAGDPKDLNWSALDGKVWVSHNRYFDNTVFNEMQKRGMLPKVAPSAWHCTANLTSYLCNRRALDDAIEFLYKTKVDKSYRAVAENKQWPQGFTEEERIKVVKAGKVDAQWCWRLWEEFSPRWSATEQRLSNITIEQGMYGVQIDVELLHKYIIDIHDLKTQTEKVIPWMQEDPAEDWDDFDQKPSSTKCIAEQCRRIGIPCPPTKSADEEGYEAWETLYAPKNPWIKAVSAWRSVNKLYATFSTLKRRLRPDGTLPFALKYFGAHTGRWAGDAKINFQNMRKQPIFGNENRLMEANEKRIFAAMEEHEETGKYPAWVSSATDFRALIVPRPGKKMIACDLAQIEPRVLAYISGNTDLLQKIRDGYGVYEAFARSTMKYTGPKFDAAFKKTDQYKLYKIQVLQLGYGAGWEKFISTALKEAGLDLTEGDPEFIEIEDPYTHQKKQVPGYGAKSREIVKGFRDASPLVTAMWAQADDGFRRSVGEDYVATLPSGRKMRYENVCGSIVIEKDKVTGKPRRNTKYSATIGGKRRLFYGGKIIENIVQAIARDVFANHIVSMDTLGWRNLFSVHDEAVLEVESSVAASDVQREMSVCPDWLQGCPLAAEAKEISHYEK